MNAPRIVSLVPSLTELLCEMGLAESIVGRTAFCIHPAATVAGIEKVGGTKNVNPRRIRDLRPTHLVVNVDENPKALVEQLGDAVGEVVVTHPIEVEDNLALYRDFGQRFNRARAAERLCDALSAAIDAAHGRRFPPRPVVYLIWKNPWMTIGADTYIARMLAMVGLHAHGPASAQRYPMLDWSAFAPPPAAVSLLSSEPYRFSHNDCLELFNHPAHAGRPVRRIDGEMTAWYGARAVAGLRYLIDWRQRLDHECPIAMTPACPSPCAGPHPNTCCDTGATRGIR